MGQNLSQEEGAIVRILLHILSKRGIKYEETTLRRLLRWCRNQGFAPDPALAFKPETWTDVGEKIWNAIGKGDKVTAKIATAWRLVTQTLTAMKAERKAAESMNDALAPPPIQRPGDSNPFITIPTIFAPIVESTNERWEEENSKNETDIIPTTQPEEPHTESQDEEIREGDLKHLSELVKQPDRLLLETLRQMVLKDCPTVCQNCSTRCPCGPAQKQEVPRLSAPRKKATREGGDKKLSAAKNDRPDSYPPLPDDDDWGSSGSDSESPGGGRESGNKGGWNPQKRREEVYAAAWREGEILDPRPIMSAYPVTLVANGANQCMSFHWDSIKEIRKSVQTYGLQAPFTQALLDNVFMGNI